VIAREDTYLDYLIDQETAVVLPDPGAADWSLQLDRLVTDTASVVGLGRRAQGWVDRNRPASHQINGILDLYRRMAGQTIPFPG